MTALSLVDQGSLAAFRIVESLPLLLKPLLRPPPSPLPNVAFLSFAHGNNSSTTVTLLSRVLVLRATDSEVCGACGRAVAIESFCIEEIDLCLD